MQDVTNSPATPTVWKERYIQLIQVDPTICQKRQELLDLDPTGTVLVNQDTRGWLDFLATKKERGLVLDGPEPFPGMPKFLYKWANN